MAKILAVDFGKKFIGLATSDELEITASPLLTLERKEKLDTVVKEIIEVCNQNNIKKIVLGLPRHISGEISKIEELERLRKILENKNFLVDFEDETGTTLLAEERLKNRKISYTEIKKLINEEAACIILESYLCNR